MKNKVLVKVYIPELNYEFDVFIPINELIWKVKSLLVKSVSDLTNIPLNQEDEFVLINKDTSEVYANNTLVSKTNIRNATELIIMSNN